MVYLHVGGVPALEQDFTWSMTTGSRPYFREVLFSAKHTATLNEMVGSIVEAGIETRGGTKDPLLVHKLDIRKVFLTEIKEGLQGTVIAVLTDFRHYFRGSKLTCSYNKTRVKNEISLLPGINLNGDPQKLRAMTLLAKEGRYLEWSIKEDYEGFTPYTMSEILVQIFKTLGIVNVKIDNTINKADYILENIEFENLDIYLALEKILMMCRLNMYVDLAGDLHITAVDYPNGGQEVFDKLLTLNKVTPSKPYVAEYIGLKPSHINVYFKKLKEVRFVNYEGSIDYVNQAFQLEPVKDVYDQQNITNWDVVGCINVVRVGAPLTNPVKFPGEWVRAEDYMRYLGVDKSQFFNSYYSQKYIQLYAIKLKEGIIKISGVPRPTTVAAARRIANIYLGTLYAGYRTTYMIDPYMMDRIEKFEPYRTTISKTYRKQRLPSPVYCDYSFLTLGSNPISKAVRTDIEQQSSNFILNAEDPKREYPTPFGVSIVDRNIGVFKITVPGDYQGAYYQLNPFAFSSDFGLPAAQNYKPLLQQLGLRDTHSMETLMSVVFATNLDGSFSHDSVAGENKYYKFKLDTLPASLGPHIDTISNLEYARYNHKEDEPFNLGTIQNIAEAESGRLFNVYKPKVSGVVEASGFVKMNPTGHLNKIEYRINKKGQISTLLDFRSFPPNPSIDQQLEQEDIKVVRGQI